MKQARQGDVFIERINTIPKTAVRENCTRKIVAYGEVTGHKHAIRAVKGEVEFFQDNGLTLVQVEQEAILEHEEHKSILLPKGAYKVGIQREQDIVQGVRQVMD